MFLKLWYSINFYNALNHENRKLLPDHFHSCSHFQIFSTPGIQSIFGYCTAYDGIRLFSICLLPFL